MLSGMSDADGNSRAPGAPGNVESSDSVEILSPIADAMKALAKAIQETPGSLWGASIATGARGTLILNRAAWRLFESDLRREIPDLVIVEPARAASQPVRFLLMTTPPPPPAKPE